MRGKYFAAHFFFSPRELTRASFPAFSFGVGGG
jgi:hypothetical protein